MGIWGQGDLGIWGFGGRFGEKEKEGDEKRGKEKKLKDSSLGLLSAVAQLVAQLRCPLQGFERGNVTATTRQPISLRFHTRKCPCNGKICPGAAMPLLSLCQSLL